jgi:hypothetical protein
MDAASPSISETEKLPLTMLSLPEELMLALDAST